VIAYISNSMMMKEYEDKLRQIFEAFDTNNDGHLNREELEEGFKQYLSD